MLPSHEFRIWVSGVPKSQQARGKHSDGYKARVQAAALAEFRLPLSGRVEVLVIYSGRRAPQLDTDNAAKLIQDALKGIAYYDDSQVKDTRVVALSEDELREVRGQPHHTFARILDGDRFLIRILADTPPSIADHLKTS
jgi:Holliday junction resolvase RusA-like endonuclease